MWLCAHRYDLYGSNFQVPLRLALSSMVFDEDEPLPPQVHLPLIFIR